VIMPHGRKITLCGAEQITEDALYPRIGAAIIEYAIMHEWANDSISVTISGRATGAAQRSAVMAIARRARYVSLRSQCDDELSDALAHELGIATLSADVSRMASVHAELSVSAARFEFCYTRAHKHYGFTGAKIALPDDFNMTDLHINAVAAAHLEMGLLRPEEVRVTEVLFDNTNI
ncbi:MAG: hypothetical protein RSC43_07580, partial [Clostridia bacterium]